ncbi:NAD kinase 2, chloroplastic [Humulus lupulus]|uniref:NAD kinase 2, chloroplastic n=1 Tax=Humulus lupulus TaxID=3486 RepID=UPI002B403233|nr:NAD kinase 2, chloroplastic [Humulus lupulus]XP_062099274.1 NAD kinase 2, chloroplastic [Humulus lupulus]XP_062099275.1 NAD kinase 2, chloroplastic [Humulus lupulus]
MVAACCLVCHLAVVVDMNRCRSATGVSSPSSTYLCPFKPTQFVASSRVVGFGFGFRFEFRRKERFQRRLKFVVSAELSKSFSLSLGLDSQVLQPHESTQLPWVGPVPGDIAEIEAYCRIFRAAEWLHAALMDTLCNPLTGECYVSYDVVSDEKPLLEDKIVSVLGCMVSLLNEGREDILSGRSSVANSFRIVDVSAIEDKLPPLAIFRSEMKRCCESLHVALENYLMPGDDRSLDVWRKLQRLKNVCYDIGFSRGEDFPDHTLFANWTPVYLSTSREDIGYKDSDVAFWRGGQVTEEGLKWLVKKGYKTIIDLRAENVKDNFYQVAINNAIALGEIELVKIPVEVGTAPSKEQVEKFAMLVSDSSKRPIYLHSKEGVQRTSAMISRWRQYMTRYVMPLDSNQPIAPNNAMLQVKNEITEKQKPISGKKLESLEDTSNNSLNSVNRADAFPDSDEMNGSSNGVCSDLIPIQGMELVDTCSGEEGSLADFSPEIDPLKAQVPPGNFISKKEMSMFFRSKRISPPTYNNYQLEKLPVSDYVYTEKIQRGETLGNDQVSGHQETGSSNGSCNENGLSGRYMTGDAFVSIGPTVNGFGDSNSKLVVEKKLSTTVSNKNNDYVKSQSETKYLNGGTSDDELSTVEGDMCASTTGVVRVQSRKKAEMFLVRTDGFSCTREKVTEASLAFTHPSTQQQMLMWKTTPKTVLLLKKLGPELMEEAKEAASYLYYQENMNVLVEPDVHDIFARIPGFGFVQTFYSQDTSDLHERVDFVACLGGDGVILHASNLFRGAVPPVVSFNLGSLGFLTSHTFDDFRQDLKQVIHGNNTRDGVYITLRMRLRCEIFRNGKAMPGKIFDVLNEVVIDRGSNPYLSKIECYEHDRLITKVQGDGVIVATPTGSTAYSTAAGGSMVHPNVPCMLFTPICPHSLSFRPVILPDSARLLLKIPDDARSNAWVSFDGKRRQQLSRGDSVRIYMSQHPLPTVNKFDQTGDWFHSLIRCLNWNERLDQKAL